MGHVILYFPIFVQVDVKKYIITFLCIYINGDPKPSNLEANNLHFLQIRNAKYVIQLGFHLIGTILSKYFEKILTNDPRALSKVSDM